MCIIASSLHAFLRRVILCSVFLLVVGLSSALAFDTTPPILLAPLNETTTNYTKIFFDWADKTDVANYELKVSSVSSFAKINYSSSPVVSQATISISANRLYYWRVRAKSTTGTYSVWSSTQTFMVDTTSPTVPVLVEPLDGLTTTQLTLHFVWNEASDATSGVACYFLECSTGTGVDAIVCTVSTSTPYADVTFGEYKDYFWRVRAKDCAGNYSRWSSTRSISVQQDIVTAPTQVFPDENYATNKTSVTFSWTPAVSMNASVAEYELQIATSKTFATVAYSTTSVGTSVGMENIDDNKIYYWRVRGKSSAGEMYSEWSSTRTFVVDTIAPKDVPTIVEPLNGYTTNQLTTLNFDWTDVADSRSGMDGYEFGISISTNFSTIFYATNTATSCVSVAFTSYGRYYWHVRAKDVAGNCTSWTAVQQVNILPNAPTTPQLIFPENNFVTNQTAIAFDWSDSVSAELSVDGYQLELSTSNDFSKIAYSVTTTVSSGTAGDFTKDAQYFWRVRAVDAAGGMSLWSDVRCVQVVVRLPEKPTNFIGTVVSTTCIMWQWDDKATNENGYRVKTATGFLITELPSNTTTYVETNLKSNTRYTRCAEAYNIAGSTCSVVKSKYTFAEAPTDWVSSTTLHKVFLSWQGNCTSYQIEISTENNVWNVRRQHISTTSHTVTGLLPGTTCMFSIRGWNGDSVITQSSSVVCAVTCALTRAKVDPARRCVECATTTIRGRARAITVEIPEDAVDEAGYVDINDDPLNHPKEVDAASIVSANNFLGDEQIAAQTIECNMYNLVGERKTETLSEAVTVSIPYVDDDNDGFVDNTMPRIPVSALSARVLDESGHRWKTVACAVDTQAKEVHMYTPHFSVYTVVGTSQYRDDFKTVCVYPNPYMPGSGGVYDRAEGVVFTRLTRQAHIRIFSLTGELLFEGDDEDNDGMFTWNAKNNSGENVASGVYVYVVTSPEKAGKACGKIAVIR